MYDLSIEYQIDEFMIYCRSRELRAKTLESYEHTLRLFERWCNDELNITQVDQVTESVIRRYITNLQERGKYTFYANEKSKEQNFPERRRDFRKPVSAATINNYIRNLKVFFNWLDSDYILKKNPMKKVRQLKTNRNAKEYISDADFKRLDYHAFRNFHVFHFLISFSLEVFLISLCLYYSNSMSKTSRYNGTYAKDDGAKLKVYFQIEKALKKMLICCFEGT